MARKTNQGIAKARYWTAVLYPENMRTDWQETIADTVQMPFAYCIHSKDTDEKSEHRKDHVHMILAFPNTTTYQHALEVFKLLGPRAVNKCEAVIGIRHMYDYLIHDTESCRKAGKHLYDESERVTGNNFDIGAYEQLSQADKNEMLTTMIDFIVGNEIQDITTFYIEFPLISDAAYLDVFRANNALIERICKGNYQRAVRSIGRR